MAEREAPGAPAFRFAAPADSAALLKIYGEYLDTPITFECALPSEAEFAGRIAAVGREYPYLVCLEKGRIVGYAYAHRQAERAAYQWNAELSVYLDRSCTSRGLGRRLYGALIDILRLQGIRTVYGCVTVPNEKSEGLHQALGFRRLGTLIFHIQIRPFKMNAKNLSALIAFFNDICHICHSLCKNLRHLGHRRRKNRCNTFLWNPLHPIPKSVRFCVIGIKTIGTVGMNIHKPRKNGHITIVLPGRFCSIGIYSLNFIP